MLRVRTLEFSPRHGPRRRTIFECERLKDENKVFDDVLELFRGEKDELLDLVKCGDIDGRQLEDAWRELIQVLERKGLSEVMEAVDTEDETIWIDGRSTTASTRRVDPRRIER